MAIVEDALCITVPEQGSVFFHPVREAGGRKFVKCCKGDHKVERLLLGQSSSNERGLTQTSIIETIVKLRNSHRQGLVHQLEEQSNEQSKEDLGIEVTAAKRKRTADFDHVLPESILVTAPAIGEVESHDMMVLLGQPTSALWVEATADNIDYLRACVSSQTLVAKQQALPAAEPIDTATYISPGITWVASRSAYRVRYKDGGKIRWKDFRATSSDQGAMLDASQKAMAFKAEQGSV